MKPLGIPATCLCALVLLVSVNARADWIILTSGEKFQTDRSWTEDGRLKFRLNGLVVSVPTSDVAQVLTPKTAVPDVMAHKPEAVNTPQQEVPNRKQRLHSAVQLPPPKTTLFKPKKKPVGKLRPTKGSNSAVNPAGKDPKSHPTVAANESVPKPSRGVFRDLAWGMRPSSIPGLLLSQTNPAYGGVDEFFHPDEVLQVGKAPLTGIVYGFWQNRLYTITVWADGRPRYEKLRQWVLDTYGSGHPSKTGAERQVWYGSGSDRLLEFDETLNTGIFWMRSEKLHARIQQIQGQ